MLCRLCTFLCTFPFRLACLMAVSLSAVTAHAEEPQVMETEVIRLQQKLLDHFESEDTAYYFSVCDNLLKKLQNSPYTKAYYSVLTNKILFALNHHETGKALDMAQQLRREALLKSSSHGTYCSLFIIASILFKGNNLDLATQYFVEAANYARLNFNDGSSISCYLQIANMLIEKNPSEAHTWVVKAFNEPLASPYAKSCCLAMECLIAFHLNDTTKFRSNYQHFQQLRASNPAECCHFFDKELKVALAYFKGNLSLAITRADSLPDHLRGQEMKALIEERSGHFRQALAIRQEADHLRDSVAYNTQHDDIAEIVALLNYGRLQNERNAVSQKNRFDVINGVVLVALLIVILLVVAIIRRRKTISLLKMKNEVLEKAHQLAIETQRSAVKSMNVKTEFIQNMKNEMGTPLNSIAGFSQVLADASFDIGKEERQEISSLIHRNTADTIALVDTLVMLSTLNDVDSLPKDDDVDCNATCRKVMDANRERLEKGVELTFVTNAAEGETFKSNARQVEGVLTRLVTNAEKFTTSGHITLSCDCRSEEGKVIFAVEDTGRVIPSKLKDAIFQRLSTENKVNGGSGLALSLCRTICTLLGGDIYLDVDYTAGSRFVVSLPK